VVASVAERKSAARPCRALLDVVRTDQRRALSAALLLPDSSAGREAGLTPEIPETRSQPLGGAPDEG
jgi:hypothetical protein